MDLSQPIPMRWVDQQTLPIARLKPTASAINQEYLECQLHKLSSSVNFDKDSMELSFSDEKSELNNDDTVIPQLIQCCLDCGWLVGLCETFTTILHPGDRCNLTTIQTRLLNELLEEVEDITLTNPITALASVYGAPLLTSNQFWVIPDAVEVLYRKFHTRVDLATVPPYLHGGIWELQPMTYHCQSDPLSDSSDSEMGDDPIEDLIMGEKDMGKKDMGKKDISEYDPEYQRVRETFIKLGERVGLSEMSDP